MSRPDKLPRWGDVTGLITEPMESEKDIGWNVAEKPPAQYMNWLQLYAYKWFKHLDSVNRGATVRFMEDFDGANPAATADLDRMGKFFMGGSTNLTAENNVIQTLGAAGEMDLTNTGASSVAGYLAAPVMGINLVDFYCAMRVQIVTRANLDTAVNGGFKIGFFDASFSNNWAYFVAGSGSSDAAKWHYDDGASSSGLVAVGSAITDGAYYLLELIRVNNELFYKINGTTVLSEANTTPYLVTPIIIIKSLPTVGPHVAVDFFCVEFDRLNP